MYRTLLEIYKLCFHGSVHQRDLTVLHTAFQKSLSEGGFEHIVGENPELKSMSGVFEAADDEDQLIVVESKEQVRMFCLLFIEAFRDHLLTATAMAGPSR